MKADTTGAWERKGREEREKDREEVEDSGAEAKEGRGRRGDVDSDAKWLPINR